MNPNNPEYQASHDNTSNQGNPNNDAYWESRGEGGRQDSGGHGGLSRFDDDFEGDSSKTSPSVMDLLEKKTAERRRPVEIVALATIPMNCPRDGMVDAKFVSAGFTSDLYIQCPFCGEVAQVKPQITRAGPQPPDQHGMPDYL